MRTFSSSFIPEEWADLKLRYSLYSVAVAAITLFLLTTPAGAGHEDPNAEPISGAGPCPQIDIADLFNVPPEFVPSELPPKIPEPAWIWVDPNDRFHSATGVLTRSKVSHTDFPTVHDSHDFVMDILVDPGLQGLLSDAGIDQVPPEGPDTLHVEWETGTFVEETGGNAPERFFPKSAWPSEGDRVWVEGHWIYDCGHPTQGEDRENRFKTEIHPIRAMASMSEKWRPMPGTGNVPVRVMEANVYIHGQAGFVTEVLECGVEIIFGGGTCNPLPFPHRGTPIDDTFVFDIPLPARPIGNESPVLAMDTEVMPGNNIPVEPIFEVRQGDSSPAFPYGRLRVTVPLESTGVTPDRVYARKIYVGWLSPPINLHHVRVTLERMELHSDKDQDPGDGELSFFWLNVDRSADEWFRLTDHDQSTCGIPLPGGECSDFNTMENYDDDGGPGNGFLDFQGPTVEFFIAWDERSADFHPMPFTLRVAGYEQDCVDNGFFWGEAEHVLDPVFGPKLLQCYAGSFEDSATGSPVGQGENDDYEILAARFGPGGLPLFGRRNLGSASSGEGGQYEIQVDVQPVPFAEDPADLAVSKECLPNPVLSNQAFECSIIVANNGPGLPRAVEVTHTLTSPNIDSTHFTMSTPSFVIGGGIILGSGICPSTPRDAPGQFTCDLNTIPGGSAAVISFTVTADRGGSFTNEAQVTTSSVDPDPLNNRDEESVTVVQVVPIDIKPGDPTNPVKVSPRGGGGRIPVAILSTREFEAPARIDVASLTFGRTGDEPSLSSCRSERADGDQLLDLLCLFDNDPRLFQEGDSAGILRGRTFDSVPILIEGRDAVRPVP